jgi:micrococcal nuclease
MHDYNYKYKCKLNRVVDGDTVDVDIDLGFDSWIIGERVRLIGIDSPETRTLDLVEKEFGFAAKQRVEDILTSGSLILHSCEFQGKFGRVLGDFEIEGQEMFLTEMLLDEGHAVIYDLEGSAKETAITAARQKLLEAGTVKLK